MCCIVVHDLSRFCWTMEIYLSTYRSYLLEGNLLFNEALGKEELHYEGRMQILCTVQHCWSEVFLLLGWLCNSICIRNPGRISISQYKYLHFLLKKKQVMSTDVGTLAKLLKISFVQFSLFSNFCRCVILGISANITCLFQFINPVYHVLPWNIEFCGGGHLDVTGVCLALLLELLLKKKKKLLNMLIRWMKT